MYLLVFKQLTVPSIAGTDAIRNVAVFFGQKRVACVHSLPQTRTEAELTASSSSKQQHLQRFAGKRAIKVFSDWVFDVQILAKDVNPHSACSPLLAVGLAHNFIQIWEPEHDHVVRTVQCAERCILYALAFHGRSSEELVVASGTVFQQILLWKPISNGANESESDETVVVPAQRLHSHDGVLFKLEWSSDASMLASVSDDRTVQLWSNRDALEFPAKTETRDAGGFFQSTEQTIAFMSALSDKKATNVVDLGSEFRSVFRSWGHTARLWDVKFCAFGLATTSEDSLCKLWDFTGNCIASLQGHMGKHVWRVAVHPSQALVATGGTDGAAKLWNLHDQVKSTSANSSAFCQSIPLFSHEDSHLHEKKTKAKGKAKTLSIRDIVVDQSHGETGFVASELGQIFKVDIQAQTSSLFFTIGGDEASKIGGGDETEGDRELASSSQPPPSNLSTFTTDSLNKVLLAGSSTGGVSIVEIATATLTCQWKAHGSRVVKIFWSRVENGSGSLFTVCADCTIREWRPVVANTTSETGANGEKLQMELLATYKSPGKCSASALLVVDRVLTRNIVCGDGRGNVFVFRRPLNLQAQDCGAGNEPQAPSLVLKSVHGREQVTSLLMRDNVLLSGGHDGYICSYLMAFNEGALQLKFIGHESIKGMTTIKSLWYNARDELFVLGFYASQAILHNFTSQYRLFSIECGGWRRPHALVTKNIDSSSSASLPVHAFLFTPPVVSKTDLLELKVHSTITQRAPFFKQPVLGKASLHHQFHGKMTTCVAKIGDRLVTAAEDNSVKLHKLQAKVRWECVSTGVAHTTTVRALTHFKVRNSHILLSGGGKQRINVWKVGDGVDVIEHVCGFEREDSLQDHRILGLETFVLRPPGSVNEDRYRLVAACNSEGSVQLLLLDLEQAKLVEVGEVSSSKKPILSCAGFQQSGDGDAAVAVLAVGSTDGMVNVWDFAGLVRELEAATLNQQLHTVTASLTGLAPVASYLAHDMGVNCLTIAHHDATSFSIISGGDDQNVCLRELSTKSLLQGSNGENDGVVSDTRAINASGSAIKAVYSDGHVVFTAGYDQRVSKWAINSEEEEDGPEQKKTKRTLQWQCAAFSECADIADIAVSEDSEGDEENGAHVVVVVGQGLQTLRFRK